MYKVAYSLIFLLSFFSYSFAMTDPYASYEEEKKLCNQSLNGPNYIYNEGYENYCDFIKFTHFDGRRTGPSTEFGVATPEYDFFEKILSISTLIYDFFPVKEDTLKVLQQFFLYCEKYGETKEIKAICALMLDDVIGRKMLKSKINLDDLFDTFKQENKVVHRQDSDTWEHFVPLKHYFYSPRESSIGDFLFGEVRDGSGDIPKSHQIYILKLGDTHRQPFVSLDLPISLQDWELYNESIFFASLELYKHKLYFTMPTFTDTKYHYITPGYELQKNGRWKLKKCWKEWDNTCKEYWNCKLKRKEISLTQCQNSGIILNTILGK